MIFLWCFPLGKSKNITQSQSVDSSLWLKNAHRGGLPCNLYGCDCIEQTNLLKSHLGEVETPKKIIKFLIILINCSSARQARKGYKMVLRHGAHNSESLPFDDFVQNSNQIIKQSIFIKHRSNRKLLSCQTEYLSHDSWCLLLQEQ